MMFSAFLLFVHVLLCMHVFASNVSASPAPKKVSCASFIVQNATNLLNAVQQQKQQMGLEAACLAFSGFPRMSDQGLDELPPTNIQGAKTA